MLIDKNELLDIILGNEQFTKLQKEEIIECINCCKMYNEVEQQQWIPCSERLPNKSGYYLVTQLVHSVKDFSKVLRHEVEYVEFMQERWCRARHLEVIAWQPLPQPFKEEAK